MAEATHGNPQDKITVLLEERLLNDENVYFHATRSAPGSDSYSKIELARGRSPTSENVEIIGDGMTAKGYLESQKINFSSLSPNSTCMFTNDGIFLGLSGAAVAGGPAGATSAVAASKSG